MEGLHSSVKVDRDDRTEDRLAGLARTDFDNPGTSYQKPEMMKTAKYENDTGVITHTGPSMQKCYHEEKNSSDKKKVVIA